MTAKKELKIPGMEEAAQAYLDELAKDAVKPVSEAEDKADDQEPFEEVGEV